jgi:hypothetical protein
MKQNAICTYCGGNGPATRDHVIPTCVFFEPSNDRSIKVDSCGACNWKSEEGLLKTFLAMFDSRITASRAWEVAHPKSRGDLQAFQSISTPDIRMVYPEDRLTRLFKKMFLGLRRHLLKEDWTFVSTDLLQVFSVTRVEGVRVIRLLPLKVGVPNQAFVLPPEMEDLFEGCRYHFRDFSFDMTDDEVMTLKYNRTQLGNELVLLGVIIEPATGPEE